jgi:hypothetical protein
MSFAVASILAITTWQHAATACNMQHATCNMQHATRSCDRHNSTVFKPSHRTDHCRASRCAPSDSTAPTPLHSVRPHRTEGKASKPAEGVGP